MNHRKQSSFLVGLILVLGPTMYDALFPRIDIKESNPEIVAILSKFPGHGIRQGSEYGSATSLVGTI